MKKHKQELSLVTKSAKKDMQTAAMKEGMKSAREKREMDRATAAELRRQLDREKERYRKRSWIRIPDRTEVMAATVIHHGYAAVTLDITWANIEEIKPSSTQNEMGPQN